MSANVFEGELGPEVQRRQVDERRGMRELMRIVSGRDPLVDEEKQRAKLGAIAGSSASAAVDLETRFARAQKVGVLGAVAPPRPDRFERRPGESDALIRSQA
jgi:hypothetical protein